MSQCFFFPFLGFLEMPLLVVVYFAIMRRNQISGLTIGALVGLAQDSLFQKIRWACSVS